jgi:sulfur-oxidizing protein SoxA
MSGAVARLPACAGELPLPGGERVGVRGFRRRGPSPLTPALSPLGRGRRTYHLAAAVLTISTFLVRGALASDIPLDQRRSDSDFVSADTRAMQNDDTANPAMLVVLDGETLWNTKAGATNKSCADCHGDAANSMKGVAARYPAFAAELGRPIDLEQRINLSRVTDQKAEALAFESKELLALTAYIARQSRGMPIAVKDDAQAKPFIDAGRAIYEQRQGQLDLSCAQCHDENWGKKLAGNPVPQAMANGYPIYRLEWQEVGSLQRRLRNCMSGMRAEPYDFGSPELVDLEYFLMWRARGLAMESPAVRP